MLSPKGSQILHGVLTKKKELGVKKKLGGQ
jgi:hypothetical protein